MTHGNFRAHDHGPAPVTALANDYPAGHLTGEHDHPYAQLLYAVRGVMVVETEAGHWVVPPTLTPDLPTQCTVLAVSPLMRELLVAAVELTPPHPAGSRAERITMLLLDELRMLPSLALHLPQPRDPRLRRICDRLADAPHDHTTATQWARTLHVDAKTIQRLFARETGMSFGQWRQQARLLAALERLAQGERVLDVALTLGYASPGAFTTMFKRQFGVTPSAYFE